MAEEIEKKIDALARELAHSDALVGDPVTLTSAIRSLTTCLRRAPTENEKRTLIASYGRWLRRIDRRYRAIVRDRLQA